MVGLVHLAEFQPLVGPLEILLPLYEAVAGHPGDHVLVGHHQHSMLHGKVPRSFADKNVRGDATESHRSPALVEDQLCEADGIADVCPRFVPLVKRSWFVLTKSRSCRLTRHSSTGTAPPQVVNNGRIAFDRPIYGQVGTVTSVGDFLIFEHTQSSHDGFGCRGTSPQERHAHRSGTSSLSGPGGNLAGE